MFPNVTGIDVALLYGSFGRNEATPNSDIDIQLLVNKDFETTIDMLLIIIRFFYYYFTMKFNPFVK